MEKWWPPEEAQDEYGISYVDAIPIFSQNLPDTIVKVPCPVGLGWTLERLDIDLVKEILERHLRSSKHTQESPAEMFLEGTNYCYSLTFVHRGEPVNQPHHAMMSAMEVLDLSRLITPNAIWPQFGVRMLFPPDDSADILIMPIMSHDRVLIRTTGRQWFLAEEVQHLHTMLERYNDLYGTLPPRLERARQEFNIASRQTWVGWRHLGMVVALEAILSTSKERSSKQFTYRLCRLAERVNLEMSNRMARRIYDARSNIAHGAPEKVEDEGVDDPLLDVHLAAEAVLKRALALQFADDEFREIFRSDESVDAFFGPVPPRVCSHCKSTAGLVCADCGGPA